MKRPSASRSENPPAPSSPSSSSEEDEPQNYTDLDESEEEVEEEASSSSDEEEEGYAADNGVVEQPKQPNSQPQKKLQSPPPKSSSRSVSEITTPLKRHVDVEPSSKRAKKNVSAEADSTAKKSAVQRVWGEDDEIAILQGIIDYVREKGVTPTRDFGSFYGFMKNLVGISIRKSQLADKVSRLKKKYKNYLGNPKKISNPHDEKLYDLSCKIWGDEGILRDVDNAKSNGTVRKKQKEAKSVSVVKAPLLSSPVKAVEGSPATGMSSSINGMIALHKSLAGENLDEGFIKEGLAWLDAEQRMEFERRWKQLQVEEWELHVKRIGLMNEEAQLIADAHKSKLG